MRGRRLAPVLLIGAALAALGAYVVPRGLAVQHQLAIADDPARLADRALDEKFNTQVATREIDAALAAKDADLANSFVALAAARHVALDAVLKQKVAAAVRELNWFLSTYIRALYALPLIALVPIVIIWVGYSPASRLVIVIISVFLPVAVTTADGTRAIAKDYLDVGRMFGARTHNVWFGIALPSAMPHIVAGIELGFARGITNAVAVEVLASVPGMGMSVFTKSNELNENASLVYVVCLAIFAISVRGGMIRFRRWLAPWYRGT